MSTAINKPFLKWAGGKSQIVPSIVANMPPLCSRLVEPSMDKRKAMQEAENAGQVADSMEVRLALMEQVRFQEITLEQAQAKLSKIKRNAKKAGKVTRSQVYSRG